MTASIAAGVLDAQHALSSAPNQTDTAAASSQPGKQSTQEAVNKETPHVAPSAQVPPAPAKPACWPTLLHGVAATLDHDVALGRERFATVIDVGANKGQFATYARLRWPQARLICFEPLPEPRAKLSRVTRGRAEIHACALGAAPGTGQMHLASRADSSSLLALGARQKSIFGMAESGTLPVPIQRLDAVITPPLARPSLLKIDVQGPGRDATAWLQQPREAGHTIQ